MAKYWDKQVARSRKNSEGFKTVVRTEAEKAELRKKAVDAFAVKAHLKALTKAGIGVRARDGKYYMRTLSNEQVLPGTDEKIKVAEQKAVDTELPDCRSFEEAVHSAYNKLITK